MIERGLLTADQARELSGLARPPVIGDCRFIRRLGEGPHGVACLVEHLPSWNRLVVKIIPRELTASAAYRRPAEATAHAAQRIEHHSVARILGVAAEAEQYYYVSEHIAGVALDELLARQEALAPRIAIGIACRVAGALAAAWRCGVCHGYLRPSSVILAEDGSVRVVGLGLLRLPPRVISLTGSGTGVYNPLYLSPEHFHVRRTGGAVIDCRSDIFSLGVMLYQMVTGQHPFAGNSAEEVRQNVWEGTPVEPAELNPAVPPALSTALSRMLAPAPEHRYQTPAELAACLNAVRAVPLPDAGTQKRATAEGEGIVPHRPSPPGRRGRRLSGIRAIVAWGLVLLAAATAIVTLALRLRRR